MGKNPRIFQLLDISDASPTKRVWDLGGEIREAWKFFAGIQKLEGFFLIFLSNINNIF